MKLAGTRFLVTGGTGFIGSALVQGLLSRGAIVRSLDNETRGKRSRLTALSGVTSGALELCEGDIRDPEAVRRAADGASCIVHLAYINGTEFFYTKPHLVLEVAVKGMMNVLDACLATGVRDLVLASSSEVYQTPPVVPTDEHAPLSVPDVLNPRYSYGGGKIISELLTINYGRAYFDRATIFRPHNCYGPDMGEEHVIPQLTRRLAQCLRETPTGPIKLPIQGSGRETRAFVHIDDLVDGVLRIVESGKHLEIYHVGNEEEISVAKVVEIMGRHVGRDVETQPGPIQPGGTPRRCPDVHKLRELGYVPRIPLELGLQKTMAWYLNNPPRSAP